MAGLQNSTDDLIMNLVMGTMFLVLPAVWLGALSWAGVSIGQSLGSAIANGIADTKNAGGKFGGAVGDAIGSKGMGKMSGK